MEKIYCFSQDQLKVLMVGCGYARVAGLNISAETLDNTTVLNALKGLTNAELIRPEVDSFVAVDSVKEIIDCLGRSEGYMVLHSNSLNLPDKCLFISDKVLVCTTRITSPGYISLGFVDFSDIYEDLRDEGYFSGSESSMNVDEQELAEYEKELLSDVDPNAPLEVSSSVILSLEEVAADGETLRFFRIIDYYFYTYIAYSDGSEVVREVYSPDNAKMYFEKMMNI